MGERCCGVGAVAHFPRRFADEDETEQASRSRSSSGPRRASWSCARANISRLPWPARRRRVAAVCRAARAKRDVGPAAEPATAIVVHPRADQPARVSFDLSVSKRGALLDPRPSQAASQAASQETALTAAGASFDSATSHFALSQDMDDLGDVTLTRSMMVPDVGLRFADHLNTAANAADDEEAADDRNIEQEMLDIIEIDRALEEMEDDRSAGTKHVFFSRRARPF